MFQKKLYQTDGFLENIKYIFICFFLLIFVLVSWVRPLTSMISSLAWIETPCIILNSEVKLVYSSSVETKNTYKILIYYKYNFNGANYVESEYNFDNEATVFRTWKDAIVSAFPCGLATKCFVNPKNPSEAVLYRGPFTSFWYGLIPFSLLIIFLRLFYNSRKKNKE